MFDIGFQEMLVIAVVALVVIGPDRLPRVARQAGQWVGKLQRYVSDVKSDINRQMELDELRRLQADVTSAAKSLEGSMQSVVSDAQAGLEGLSGSSGVSDEPRTDWDKIYANRRLRDRYKERRADRARMLGHKVHKPRR